VVYGSEGRKEQTFKTDQDNALVYTNPATPEQEEEAKKYFSAFTSQVSKSLIQVGFPPCPANYMASNPEWCQPVRIWKRYISQWINEPIPEALLKILIFFDLRPVYGKFSLTEEIKNHLFSLIADNQLFFGYMASMMLQITPPLGFFKTFVVEKSGEHKDKFDLKVKGLTPLLDAIRLFSMEKGVKEYTTMDRIQALKNKHSVVQEYAEELEHAFEFVLLLRIHHQYEQIKEGRSPDNFINPDQLSNLEKKTIKEAFNLMSKIQNKITERYKSLIR
jgi:CBS domain-containing protein